MDKRVLIICRGIQGSGKSTWAKQWCHEDPEHRVRFNNDDIRTKRFKRQCILFDRFRCSSK